MKIKLKCGVEYDDEKLIAEQKLSRVAVHELLTLYCKMKDMEDKIVIREKHER